MSRHEISNEQPDATDYRQPPAMSETEREFYHWWRPKAKKGGPYFGCSENWGAKEAWQAAASEIASLRARVAELERENAELKEHDCSQSCEACAKARRLLAGKEQA